MTTQGWFEPDTQPEPHTGPCAHRGLERPTRALGMPHMLYATVHCTILVVDIEGFAQPSRTNTNQVQLRRGLYDAVQQAFQHAGIHWGTCRHEDRGDGVFVLAPATVPKVLFTEQVLDTLADTLSMHNNEHDAAEQIRLRAALHAGEITYDDYGVTAASINHTFRLLEAPVLKAALARSSALLACASSSWFYDEVIRHSEPSKPNLYQQVAVKNKETTTNAWIRLLG